jgi:hypothetical protein
MADSLQVAYDSPPVEGATTRLRTVDSQVSSLVCHVTLCLSPPVTLQQNSSKTWRSYKLGLLEAYPPEGKHYGKVEDLAAAEQLSSLQGIVEQRLPFVL